MTAPTIATLWVDGAENYGTTTGIDITALMNEGLWDASAGIKLSSDFRTGLYSFLLADPENYMRRSLGGDQDYVKVMFSVKFPNLPLGSSRQFATVQFRNYASEVILTLDVLPTGRLRLLDYQGVQLAVSTREIAAGVHNHLEVNFSATAGYLHVRVNGNDAFIVSATGNHGGQFYSYPDSAHVNPAIMLDPAEVLWGAYSTSETPVVSGVIVDDIATFTTAVTDENTYLGLYGVYWLQPNAEGMYTGFAFSTGSTGYNLVNENPPDGDTTFIYASTSGLEASYPVAPLPTNVVSVYSVLPLLNGRKTDAGPGSVQIGVKVGGTDALNGADMPLLTNYSYFTATFDQNPATSTAWSPTALPQVLVKRTV